MGVTWGSHGGHTAAHVGRLACGRARCRQHPRLPAALARRGRRTQRHELGAIEEVAAILGIERTTGRWQRGKRGQNGPRRGGTPARCGVHAEQQRAL
eukprot:4378781-Prymnesium_polylepis.1